MHDTLELEAGVDPSHHEHKGLVHTCIHHEGQGLLGGFLEGKLPVAGPEVEASEVARPRGRVEDVRDFRHRKRGVLGPRID